MNDSFDKTISGGKFDEVFIEVSHMEDYIDPDYEVIETE